MLHCRIWLYQETLGNPRKPTGNPMKRVWKPPFDAAVGAPHIQFFACTQMLTEACFIITKKVVPTAVSALSPSVREEKSGNTIHERIKAYVSHMPLLRIVVHCARFLVHSLAPSLPLPLLLPLPLPLPRSIALLACSICHSRSFARSLTRSLGSRACSLARSLAPSLVRSLAGSHDCATKMKPRSCLKF